MNTLLNILLSVFGWVAIALIVVAGVSILLLLVVTAPIWIPPYVYFISKWATKVLFIMQPRFGSWFLFEELKDQTGLDDIPLKIILAILGGESEKVIIRRIREDQFEEIGEERSDILERQAMWFRLRDDKPEIFEFSMVKKGGGKKRKLLPKFKFKWAPQSA